MRNFTPRYDEERELELVKHQGKMHAIMKNLPQWRQQLAHHKGVSATKNTRRKRQPANLEQMREARENVELEAAATLRKCAEALQMALDAVDDVPAPTQYHSHFNCRAVRDILFIMRKKMKV